LRDVILKQTHNWFSIEANTKRKGAFYPYEINVNEKT